jgi:CRP-like cAMP-binding protein
LGREKLSYLAQRALRAEYADEEVILEEGTVPMDKVFLILKGHVKVSCSSDLPAGKGSLNARELVLGPGEHFGLREMLYENGQRGGFPSLKRYIADCSSGAAPSVMAIHAHDFLKVMP